MPTPVIFSVERFLSSVESEQGAQYGYMSRKAGHTTTAVGLLCRMYTGWRRDNPAIYSGVSHLREWGPSLDNIYYNYYATQVMFHFGGSDWDDWNRKMRGHLFRNQSHAGHESGSWFFSGGYGDTGGRLYNTAMAILILEVYYRYLPLYGEASVQSEFRSIRHTPCAAGSASAHGVCRIRITSMSILAATYRPSLALLADLYELTMAYGYWKSGIAQRQAVFYLSFRQNPFHGGYAVCAGLATALEYLEGLRFQEDDLSYLASLAGNDGRPLLEPEFLAALGQLRLECDVDAVAEGTVVFPHEPLVRVTGPLVAGQLLESALLNIINFQTLVATKAARLVTAARGEPVLEFGLRRRRASTGRSPPAGPPISAAARPPRTSWPDASSASPSKAPMPIAG